MHNNVFMQLADSTPKCNGVQSCFVNRLIRFDVQFCWIFWQKHDTI